MELEVEWSISMLCLYSSNVNDILMCIAICVYVCRDEIVECKKAVKRIEWLVFSTKCAGNKCSWL